MHTRIEARLGPGLVLGVLDESLIYTSGLANGLHTWYRYALYLPDFRRCDQHPIRARKYMETLMITARYQSMPWMT